MENSFENLESPFLDGELEFAGPAKKSNSNLAGAAGESPFANLLELIARSRRSTRSLPIGQRSPGVM